MEKTLTLRITKLMWLILQLVIIMAVYAHNLTLLLSSPFFFEFFFETRTYADQKFAFANGDPTGYGYHGDFVMGWTDRGLLQTAHRDCISAADCPKLGNQPRNARPLIHPAIYEEEIGLNGPIPALPGNNPVVGAVW